MIVRYFTRINKKRSALIATPFYPFLLGALRQQRLDHRVLLAIEAAIHYNMTI